MIQSNKSIFFFINKSNVYPKEDDNGKIIKVGTTLGPDIEIGLPDLNIYNNDGTIHEASLEDNANNFLKILSIADTDYKAQNLFELHFSYHFASGGNYKDFLQFINNLVVRDNLYIPSLSRKKHIINLIEYTAQNFEKTIFYDVTIGRLSKKYQCLIDKSIGVWRVGYKKIVDETFKSTFESTIAYSLEHLEKFLQHNYDFYSYEKEDWLNNTKLLLKEIAGFTESRFVKEQGIPIAEVWIEKKSIELSGEVEDVKNRVITERQQSLFIHYIDKRYKVNKTQNRNASAKVMLKFLNKNPPNVGNSNIYKHILYPLKHEGTPESIKKLINDLKFVKNLFYQLQSDIVNMIDEDIASIENDLVGLQ